MSSSTTYKDEIERLRSVMRAVRYDLWTASVHSNLRRAYECREAALAKLDAELGTVTKEERLEALFPNLRASK